MIARSHHHQHGRPICPYCGGINVREIGEEGNDDHRHVCMDPRCPELTIARRQQQYRSIEHGLGQKGQA